MNHPSDSCIHPGLLTQAPDDITVYSFTTYDCTPEPPFQPQPSPMEFTDNSLEYHQTTSSVDPYASQGSLADPDISRYITLPEDLHYQPPFPIPEERNDESTPEPAKVSNNNHHETNIVIKQEGTPIPTHSRRSSRSSNKLTSDESSLEKRERNRKAANKCRKKQKLANEELKERARVMDEQHNYLVSHKALLESEMLELKNQLLIHGACGCEPISNYLIQAANNYANGRVGESQNAGRRPSSSTKR
ncbi:hypothetical protein F4805DRAFT_421831 [Annulohypoxylon moriforme]|nr:hypothetical protein F4805DRAFT_421831 [Annulohypoxylon moriforme]